MNFVMKKITIIYTIIFCRRAHTAEMDEPMFDFLFGDDKSSHLNCMKF